MDGIELMAVSIICVTIIAIGAMFWGEDGEVVRLILAFIGGIAAKFGYDDVKGRVKGWRK